MSEREQLALQVIELAKAAVLTDNHFLSWAIGRLPLASTELDTSFSTDGYVLGYDAGHVLERFKRTGRAPKRNLLHSVAHCLFLHPYVSASSNRALWDLACDIAAERVVADLLGALPGERGARMALVFERIERDMGARISAEKVYRHLREGRWTDEAGEWASLMRSDSHDLWYAPASSSDTDQGEGAGDGTDPSGGVGRMEGNAESYWERSADSGEIDESATSSRQPTSTDIEQIDGADDGPQSQDASHGSPARSFRLEYDGDTQRPGQGHSGDGDVSANIHAANNDIPGHASHKQGNESAGFSQRSNYGTEPGNDVTTIDASQAHYALRQLARPTVEEQKSAWRQVATSLAVNLQTLSAKRGASLAGFVDDLNNAARQRNDYEQFLRHFAIPGEVMRLSEDEFDNVFYTYGLALYGNVPLIEPLEYREEKRVREFVIVIDTSASVRGEIVQNFVNLTFDLLKQAEAFFDHVHVRILQCDAQVQTDDRITNLDELVEWGRGMRVIGGGGTDFRPAFEYVNTLVAEGAFHDLGGLVYFTDGQGTYPERMPDYRCAFVFWGDPPPQADVPPWAIQVALDADLLMDQ